MEGTPLNFTAATLGTFDVGDVQVMELNNCNCVNSGDSLNIKIIDVQTKQLICDRTIRF